MRVVFAGTPEFAVVALAAILDSGFEVPLVLTRPDRAAGRGLRTSPSPVKRAAERAGLTVLQPPTLQSEEARRPLLACPADVLVVAAYGLILPREVLDWPRHGCLNIHASLLPRWRGAAPIQRALMAGDTMTGITIMQMDAGLDSGPVVAQRELPIGPQDSAGMLHDRLAEAGAEAIVAALSRLTRDGRLDAVPQPSEGVCYAAKIGRGDRLIDWTRPAEAVSRQVRALAPSPGAETMVDGVPMKIFAADAVDIASPGAGVISSVDASGIRVGCGSGQLHIRELQRAGGKRLAVRAFLAGHRLRPDQRLGTSSPPATDDAA